MPHHKAVLICSTGVLAPKALFNDDSILPQLSGATLTESIDEAVDGRLGSRAVGIFKGEWNIVQVLSSLFTCSRSSLWMR